MKYFLIFLSFRTPDVSVTITSSDLAGVLQGTLSPLQVEMFEQLVCQSKIVHIYPGVPDRSNLSSGRRPEADVLWQALKPWSQTRINVWHMICFTVFLCWEEGTILYYVTKMTFSIWDSKFPRFWISWVKCNYYRNADLATRQSKKATLCCNYQCLGTLVRTNAQCNNDEIRRSRNLYYCKHFDTTTYRADESCHCFGSFPTEHSMWTFVKNIWEIICILWFFRCIDVRIRGTEEVAEKCGIFQRISQLLIALLSDHQKLQLYWIHDSWDKSRSHFRWAKGNHCQDGCGEEGEGCERRRRREGAEPQSGRCLRHCCRYWEGEWRTRRLQTVEFSLMQYCTTVQQLFKVRPMRNATRSLRSWLTCTGQTKWPSWCRKSSLLWSN